jgi:hypothetical protein
MYDNARTEAFDGHYASLVAKNPESPRVKPGIDLKYKSRLREGIKIFRDCSLPAQLA